MAINVNEMREQLTDPYHLLTTSDGIQLFLRIWLPPSEEVSETAILILHGITAHSEPYRFIAQPLSQHGFTVYGLDLRGHGLSDGTRGDSPGWDTFVNDLTETVSYIKEKHSKVVLLGHSLGVFSSVTAINNCLDKIDGAILLSAGTSFKHGVGPNPSAISKLKILFSSIFFPSRPVIEYGREEMVGLDDPLFTFYYTLRFMRLIKFDKIELPSTVDIPFLVSIGDKDELFSVESCKALFDLIPSNTKVFEVIPDARHAVFPKNSWVGILDWLRLHFENE